MNDFWSDIQQKLKDLLGGWTSYVALGSFSLYLLGYLAIRFHLTALGIATDLSVIDERYVFAGAKFLVYFFSNLPIVVLFALALVLVIAVLNWPAKLVATLFKRVVKFLKALIPRKKHSKSENVESQNAAPKISESSFWLKLNPFSTPTRAAFSGIAISVLMIQLLMRKSFMFSNLLLEGVPDSGVGLENLLLPNHDRGKLLYFLAFTAGTTICAGIWIYARQLPNQQTLSTYLLILLASLVAVQFLFLPIYYGVFVMDKSIPRVVDLGDQVSLSENQKAWLIWEGSKGATYLVHETGCPITPPSQSATPNSQPGNANAAAIPTQSPAPATPPVNPKITLCITGAHRDSKGVARMLVTLPQKDNTRIQILGYDSVATLSFFQDTEP